jgi:hypothetical protein
MSDLTFDRRFDRNMTAIAARATFPPAPVLRVRVLAAIDRPPRTSMPSLVRGGLRAPFTLAAAFALVAAAVVTVLAVPSSRSAVADFFGIEGSEIEVIPSTTPLPPPDDIRDTAQLTTVDGASGALGFKPALPSDAGDPGAVYLVQYGTQRVAVLRYDAFDLWEAHLAADANFGKGAPPGVTVTDTFVNGAPARWISGGPHIVQFNDATGEPIESSIRTVYANTLIWNDGETFFRMETALSLEDAKRIAESLP